MSRVTQASVTALALLVVGVLAQLPVMDRSLVPIDEGNLATAASSMLQGKLLYQDLESGIFPGIFFIAASLFHVFGSDILVTRWAQLILNLGVCLVLWRVATRVVTPAWSLLPPMLYLALVVISFPVLTMLNYSSVSAGLGLGALLFLLRYLESGRSTDAVLLGLLLAGCALTKQNFGAYVLVALVLGLVWGWRGSALAGRSFVSSLWPVIAAGAAPTLVVVIYFVGTGTLENFLQLTVFGLLESQLSSFNNPLPPLFGSLPLDDGRFIFLYSPPTLFNALLRGEQAFGFTIYPHLLDVSIRISYGLPLLLLAGSPLLIWQGRNEGTSSQSRSTRAVVVFAGLLFIGIFPSCVFSHLAYVMAPTLLLFAMAGNRIQAGLEGRRRLAGWLVTGPVALGVLLLAVVIFRVGGDVSRWYPEPLGIPGATLHLSPDQVQLYRETRDFVDACDPLGTSLFVAPDIPIVYFLTGRSNPTPYGLLLARNVKPELIIQRLEAEKTPCIVYNPKMYAEFEAFEEIYPELSAYLTSRYEVEERIRGGTTEWHGLVRRLGS